VPASIADQWQVNAARGLNQWSLLWLRVPAPPRFRDDFSLRSGQNLSTVSLCLKTGSTPWRWRF